MRLVVVIGIEAAIALQHAEAARVLVDESGDLQRSAVGDRTPDPFAGAGQNLQARRCRGRWRARRRDEGGRAGRTDKRPPWTPRPRWSTSTRAKSVSSVSMIVASPARTVKRKAPVRLVESSRAWTIKRVGRRARLFDPERSEYRKFLALRIAGADRQAARGKAVALASGERAEEGRAMEDRPRPTSLRRRRPSGSALRKSRGRVALSARPACRNRTSSDRMRAFAPGRSRRRKRSIGAVNTNPRCSGSSVKGECESAQIAVPALRRIEANCSKVSEGNGSGSGAVGAL